MKYADIVIDNKSKATDNLYTYAFDETKMDVKVGSKVAVSFGKGRALRDGFVFDVHDSVDKEVKGLKYIESIDEKICLSPEIIDTCIWMRRRYLCKYIDGIRSFLPPGSEPKRKSSADLRPPADVSEEKKELNGEQQAATEAINRSIEQDKHEIFLLQGVTGSGKTEIYMQCIERCLEKNRTAIMMVPEISLTSQMIDRFEKRFGSSRLAVLHSKLSRGRRYEEWLRIRSGEVRIVIGARSAIFAPLSDIGCIIMDEEHETTYKSDMTPKYETVEIAIKRAKAYGGVIILGSATPSVVTRNRAEKGIYTLLKLNKRYNEVPLPKVFIADMRKELQDGNRTMFSRKLFSLMRETLDEGKQIILFLNRRGFSSFISCRECGNVIRCPDCGISMTYHKSTGNLVCHYCGSTQNVPDKCPECGSRFIKFFGTGTEKLQEETMELFPENTVERLDFDSIQKKGSLDRVLKAFSKKKIDILIGTQLVAKGLDFANVGLVGIMSADSALNIPDFRSPERTFQLITQASGRAGRGTEQGKVVIQTYDPAHYAVKAAAMQDYSEFYSKEIYYREQLGYPPFYDLIQVVFSSESEEMAAEEADIWHEQLNALLGDRATGTVFRPNPAPMSRIKEVYRYSMLVKSPSGDRGVYLGALDYIREKRQNKAKKVFCGIDINPYSFM